MGVPAGSPVTGTVKAPVLVADEVTTFAWGVFVMLGVSPQVIPSAVIVPPPLLSVPPSVAVLVVTDAEVGLERGRAWMANAAVGTKNNIMSIPAMIPLYIERDFIVIVVLISRNGNVYRAGRRRIIDIGR
jgi:hypothetical protein